MLAPADDDIKLCILLAGPTAQKRFAPRSNWLTADFNTIIKIIKRMGAANKDKSMPASFGNDLANIRRQVEQIVHYFWNDIEAGAKELVKHETLTGDEIAAAIRIARRKTGRRQRIGDPPAFALARPPGVGDHRDRPAASAARESAVPASR